MEGTSKILRSEKLKKTLSTLPLEQRNQLDKNTKKITKMKALQQKIFAKKFNKTSNEYKAYSPSGDDEIADHPMKNPYMFQGDVILTDTQMDNVIAQLQHELDNKTEVGTISKRDRRSIMSPMPYKWAFPIKYFLAPSLAVATKDIIVKALAEMQTNTCVRFAKQAAAITTSPGLNVMKSDGCWSYVGQIYSNKPQELSIGEGCQYNGIIQHEFSHALGLEHEQSRPDRDSFLNVYPANMEPGTEDQFTKSAANTVTSFGIALDMGSGMMYGSYDFSSNGQKTLAPKDTNFNEDLGQIVRLSFSDYKILTLNYCAASCTTKITCSNGGYQNPNACTQCICPNGFAGTLCTAIKTTGAACGTIELKATTAIQTLTKTGALNCYFRITTDANFKIRILVKSVKVSSANPCVVQKGLEIKFQTDMTNSGAAFCGTSTAVRTITSARNLAMVHFPGLAATHSFSLTYQRV
uniref:Zinc metalloproteinase n=1 Tax=Rhabditophanes sp. KR3021 TaxID=114890 RepID=A0AC35TS79_9BILA